MNSTEISSTFAARVVPSNTQQYTAGVTAPLSAAAKMEPVGALCSDTLCCPAAAEGVPGSSDGQWQKVATFPLPIREL